MFPGTRSFPLILKSPSLFFITTADTKEVWKAFLLPGLEIKLKLERTWLFLTGGTNSSELGWCKHPISPWGTVGLCRGGALENSNWSRPKWGSRQEECKTEITIQQSALVPTEGSEPIYTGKRGHKSGLHSGEWHQSFEGKVS